MSPEIPSQILEELEVIRWLLLVLVIFFGMFLFIAISAILRFSKNSTSIKENLGYQKFQRETETTLQRGAYEEVISSSRNRLASHPSDIYANYFLAQALFHTNQYLESKRIFLKIAELEPGWQRTVDAWDDRLEQKIKDNGPKLVN